MSRWTPSSWSRACAKSAEENVKVVVKMKLEREGVLLKAEEWTVRGKKSYEITGCVHENGKILEDIFEMFKDKEEANAYWVKMKRRYF